MGHPLLDAVAPVADALGASLVGPGEVEAGDVPLVWEGDVVGALRLPGLHGALHRLVSGVERELGPLSGLSREGKQEAVRRLHERGAFTLRRGVEDVADALGVSRFTIYNYLNALDRRDDERET